MPAPIANATKVVIIYSVYSYVRRRTIIAHDDTTVNLHATENIQPGEAAIIVPRGHYNVYGGDGILQMVTGFARGSDRCAMISGNKVIGFICADPRIRGDAAHPLGYRLVLDVNGTMKVGDTVM